MEEGKERLQWRRLIFPFNLSVPSELHRHVGEQLEILHPKNHPHGWGESHRCGCDWHMWGWSGKDQELYYVEMEGVRQDFTSARWEAEAFKCLPSPGCQRKLQLQPLPLSLSTTVPNPEEVKSSGRVGGGGRGWSKDRADLSPSVAYKPTGLAWEGSLSWRKDWNVNLDLEENPKITLKTMDLAQK